MPFSVVEGKLIKTLVVVTNPLLQTLMNFIKSRVCPWKFILKDLIMGKGIEATFEVNKAVWHKTCILKSSDLKLERVLKKHTAKVTQHTQSSFHTRVNSNACQLKRHGFSVMNQQDKY